MPRSLKKEPFIDKHILKKVVAAQENQERKLIKTWSRRSMITPEFVGFTISIHDGRKHVPVFITENMVGYKFGDFAPSRVFRKHGGVKAKKTVAKT